MIFCFIFQCFRVLRKILPFIIYVERKFSTSEKRPTLEKMQRNLCKFFKKNFEFQSFSYIRHLSAEAKLLENDIALIDCHYIHLQRSLWRIELWVPLHSLNIKNLSWRQAKLRFEMEVSAKNVHPAL